LATVTGRVASAPYADSGGGACEFASFVRPPQTRFLLDAETVSTAEGPATCSGRIDVAVEGVTWLPAVGRRVRVAGRLSRIAAPTNPGQRDRRRYARRDGVVTRLTTPSEELITVLDDAPAGLSRLLWRLRAVCARRLGGAAAELRRTQEAMVRAGVAHFLSISGLHLGILLGFAYLLMRLGRISPRRGAILVLGLLACYLLLVEPRTPVLRGAMMAAAFCAAVILGRSACTANLLAAAALALLVADPVELFRPGFQLSFGIVAGILLLMKPVRRFLFGRWLRRRRLLVFADDERLRRWWWDTGLGWTADLLSVSVAAYLAALPLVAYHFGVITPAAPLASLVLLPVVAVTLIGGYLHLVLTWWLPNLSAGTVGPLEAIVDHLGAVATWLGRLPLCIDLHPIGVGAAVGLGCLVLATVHHRRLRLSRAWACVLLVGGAVVFVATTQLPPPAAAAEFTVLDVRNGMCAVLRTRSGRTYLFDAGSRSLSDPYRQVLAPYLTHRRWPTPSAAFISHGEVDHYNAAAEMLAPGGPAFVVSEHFARGADPAEPIGRFARRLARAAAAVHRLHRGHVVRLDGDTTVTCLWPPPAGRGYDALTANDSSLVLRLGCGGVRILLPGDIEELGQRLLLELDRTRLAADVLVLPHHGSYTAALGEFIDAVDPAIVIRSAGYRRTGAAESLGPLTVHRRFAATNVDGSVSVVCEDGQARLSTFGGSHR